MAWLRIEDFARSWKQDQHLMRTLQTMLSSEVGPFLVYSLYRKGGYTTVSDVAEATIKAYIFLNRLRFGQSNPNYDQRLYDAIKVSGLKQGFNFLTKIKLLTQTVFHELTHVAGDRKFSTVSLP